MVFGDSLYLVLVMPAFLLALWAQFKVKSAYNRYRKVGNSAGFSGAEAAQEILSASGIHDVQIEPTTGWLSDHYDPSSKKLRLSPEVYQGRSLASVGIAAHEAGHALQHAFGYAPMALRTGIVPIANIGSKLAMPLILIGFIFHAFALVKLGILFFGMAVVFYIITLPVEFNASSRAKLALVKTGIVSGQAEMDGVRSVLGAAAMTYVASAAVAIAQLLYYVLRVREE